MTPWVTLNGRMMLENAIYCQYVSGIYRTFNMAPLWLCRNQFFHEYSHVLLCTVGLF